MGPCVPEVSHVSHRYCSFMHAVPAPTSPSFSSRSGTDSVIKESEEEL